MRLMTRGLLLVIVTTLLGIGVGALPASAHSQLISITPKDGATLPSSPTEVVLTFNEDVNPQFVTVRVTDSEGGDVVGAKATADGPKVTLPVGDPIAAGSYNIVYRVVSADSHPISGSTTFTIEGDPQAPAPSATSSSADPSASSSESTSPSASGPVAPAPSASSTDAADSPQDQSGDNHLLVWALVLAALAAAVGATLYAVRKDRGSE